MSSQHLDTLKDIYTSFTAAYIKTPTKLKLLDAFSCCALATALLQVSAIRPVRHANRCRPCDAARS